MSRLDQLIDAVRTRFLVQKLLDYGAWTLCCAAGVVLLLILVARIFLITLPPYTLLMGGAAVLAILVALVLALVHSPSREGTAIKVDEVLGLKERFSTALEARGSSDPFARAAVTDAEARARDVSIKHRFPLRFPRQAAYTMAAILALFLTDRFMPQLDVTGKQEKQRQAQVLERKREQARDALQSALAEVMSVPKVGPAEKSLAEARRDIEALLSQEIRDPTEAVKTASRAAAEAEAAKKKIEEAQKYGAGEIQKEPFKQLVAGQGDQPGDSMEQARQSLADGQFDKAAAALRATAEKFNTADAQTKAQMANDMKGLAEQLAKIAQDPATQQRIQKELEKQGATQEQARRMTEEMARAAAGDRQAQQRVRDMAENLARRNNGGMLPAPEALAPLMQKIGEMQAQANSQQRAAEMAQATQQLAGAMQKQAQQQQQSGQQAQNQGRQGTPQGSQNAQAAQQGSQQQQSGDKQGDGQSQQASQSGQQQGDGQAGQQPGDSQNTDGQAAMEAAMAQLEAMQQEAEMAAGQGGEGEEGGDAGMGWGDQMGQGDGQGKGEGFGPAGPNQGGIGEGPRPGKSPAPYTVKREVSKGETNQQGRVLAGWLVKADSIKGESREQLKELIVSAEKDAAEDVEQDRVPMRAQKAVRDYFDSMQQ